MRNLLNPRWILIINTLPIAVLFLFGYGQFTIIKSLLDEDNINLWTVFAGILAFLVASNFLYAVYLILKKKEVSPYYGSISLVCYIAFLYLYIFRYAGMIPSSIPDWMMSGTLLFYVATFLMPTLAYSLFILVTYFTPQDKEHRAGMNFLVAILIPVFWYVFFMVVAPIWHPDNKFAIHVGLIALIIGTLLFLFFLARTIFILATKKAAIWKKYELVWKIPVAIIFPLAGLAINNGDLIPKLYGGGGIFGNYSNYWFYILALINGILICLPSLNNRNYRIFLFATRAILLAFTFYFFLVFLPFLPLSVFAIIAVGTGFLTLTPLVLFIIHINELSTDFSYLKEYFSTNTLRLICVVGFMIIPTAVTVNYLSDKRTLNETLEYIYSPDYSKEYDINTASLQKTIAVIKQHKDRRGESLFAGHTPYLSAWFNYLVLDNLTLSDIKINKIEKIFFADNSWNPQPERLFNQDVKISGITSKSTYNSTQDAWTSWVNLEITNYDKTNRESEYATTIDLPEGCWISDYYLYIGDKKEMGILAEKKSAMWVFSEIRRIRRDPGLLHYLTGNKVAFRIYPFTPHEIRKTGIQFIHKEPLQITIDNNTLNLGNNEETKGTGFENENIIYISAQQKQQLKQVQRKPYFHYVVDVSKGKEKFKEDFSKRIKGMNNGLRSLSENARITFANSYSTTYPLDNNWKNNYQSQTFDGGFYLERAIQNILWNSYKKQGNTYPVIVVITDTIKKAILEKDFSDLEMAFPESNVFFSLGKNNFQIHSLTSDPLTPFIDSVTYNFNNTVREYRKKDNSAIYLPDNNEPSVVLKNDIFKTDVAEIREKNWTSALIMNGKWKSQVLHPETADKEWVDLVEYSFISKVMSPLTSYIVVENEAQKEVLKRKQKQVLSGNKSLDVGEDAQKMSEPGLFVMLILLAIVLWYEERRKLKNEITPHE